MNKARVCRCGHERTLHEHWRRGTDCAACGPLDCPTFRRAWLRRRREQIEARHARRSLAPVVPIGAAPSLRRMDKAG